MNKSTLKVLDEQLYKDKDKGQLHYNFIYQFETSRITSQYGKELRVFRTHKVRITLAAPLVDNITIGRRSPSIAKAELWEGGWKEIFSIPEQLTQIDLDPLRDRDYKGSLKSLFNKDRDKLCSVVKKLVNQ